VARLFQFRQIAELLAAAEYDEADTVSDHRLEDVVAVGEHLADRVVGREQRLVADVLRAQHRELAGPGELRVIRIDLELGGWRRDTRLATEWPVPPFVRGRQLERRLAKFVTFRVVLLELLAVGDRAVV